MRFQGGDRAQKRITSPSDGHEIHSLILISETANLNGFESCPHEALTIIVN